LRDIYAACVKFISIDTIFEQMAEMKMDNPDMQIECTLSPLRWLADLIFKFLLESLQSSKKSEQIAGQL
tara:strand:+ start:29 stop:235 length:207 start_codon:yes stop_codon:yes gene_type:complete